MNLRRAFWHCALALAALVLLYQLWIFAHICWWVDHAPDSSAFMAQRLALLQERNPDARLRHRWVPYSRISIHLKRAVIVAEDAKFTAHEGFDWEGIQKAYEKNLRRKRIVAGGSTISQQLAKNLFLSTRRTPWRKLEEAVITLMLEQVMSKRRIFEIYLNSIEWGNGVFGVEAAAQRYYGIPAAELGPEMAAQLAAMIPSPRYYERHPDARRLNRRAGIILLRMEHAAVP